MNQDDFNEALEDSARGLAQRLELPLIAVPIIFRALSASYFLGFEDGAKRVLQSYDKHSGIHRND